VAAGEDYGLTMRIGEFANPTASLRIASTGTIPAGTVFALYGTTHTGSVGALGVWGHTSQETITVDYSNAAFVVAGTTATITLKTLASNRQKLAGIVVDPRTAFAGTAVSTMTCSVGSATSGNEDIYTGGTSLSVMQATESYSTGGMFSGRDLASPDASLAVVLSCTANTNFGNGAATVLTAGKLWVTLFTTSLADGS